MSTLARKVSALSVHKLRVDIPVPSKLLLCDHPRFSVEPLALVGKTDGVKFPAQRVSPSIPFVNLLESFVTVL